MTDTLKIVACRLPQTLIAEAQRYADLYHSSMSELLRQGLEYRLSCAPWPPAPPDHTQAVPPHVIALLTDLARHVEQVQHELLGLSNTGVYNGNALHDHTPTTETTPAYNSHTSQDVLPVVSGNTLHDPTSYNGRTSAKGDIQPGYDATRFVLGTLCPRDHAYQGTGQSLLRLPKYVCPQCDAERAREKRQAKRQRES